MLLFFLDSINCTGLFLILVPLRKESVTVIVKNLWGFSTEVLLFELFCKKNLICQWYVSLWLWMFVAGWWANKVGGTLSWCQETMRFWHLNMKLLKVNKGTLRPPSWFLTIFSPFLRLKVFRSITFKYLYDSKLIKVLLLLEDSDFSTGAALRHLWPNSAIANGTMHAFHNLWVIFHLLQGRVQKIIHWSIQNSSCT